MTTYVLDASAGADLLLDALGGRSILDQLQSGAQQWVPEHYFVEVASVLRRAELSGIINAAKAASALRSLAVAPLRRVQIRPLLEESWSKRGHLTVVASDRYENQRFGPSTPSISYQIPVTPS